ncbi:hypothetical protein BDW22DRAFT_1350370 [Trametopsis cervina]|nr:hypothetical protein BDW22DRAFT_1350370 [Trametopsis cervina]
MDQAPDTQSIQAASELEVYDSSGAKIKFGTLISSPADGKTVVVFIRHFFCGICQAYITELAKVKDTALDKAKVKLVVVGCGGYQPIKDYGVRAGYDRPIYADTSRALFKHFGLTENLQTTPADQPVKNYIAGRSRLGNALNSIWNGPLQHPQHIGKQGNISQLGGEFIFGADNQCLFAYRMLHTEDHTDVEELMKHAGVEFSG